MPFSAALSEHPVTAYAVGEAVGQVLETLGPHPDLAAVFVTQGHAGALEDAVSAVRTVLSPSVLVGCASESVVGTGREVEARAGVVVWAGRFGPVIPVRLLARPSPEGFSFEGLPAHAAFAPQALLLIGDPFSFPADEFLALAAERDPELPVIGGMASGARGPGGTRLALDDRVYVDGAVGALLGPGMRLSTVVSQGCRPIGAPFVITRAERNLIYELAGKPAFERINEIATCLSPDDVRLVNTNGLYVGRVIDERKATFERGDFLVRTVVGGDRESGVIAVNDVLEVGTTVQFHVRDAQSADEDLRAMLSGAGGADPQGALLFTCNGRGTGLFGVPDHDAGAVTDIFGPIPTAGISAAGELGPVGGRNFLHGFTASLALFSDV
jgi:small ligand-binding sensory domain FIST